MSIRNIRFEEWEAEQLRDPKFRAAAEALEYSYQLARLRLLKGLTQQQLADRVGTSQSAIARLENGNANPTLAFVRRVAAALGARLVIQIDADDAQPSFEAPQRHRATVAA